MEKNRFPLRLLWIVALVTVILGSTSLILPFGRDQGIHAYIADSMIHGFVPYRDVYNIKPPLTTIVHALALILFGHSMTSIRILDLFLSLIISLLLLLFAWRAFNNKLITLASAALFSYQYFQLDYWNSAQTDGWASLPLACASIMTLLMWNDCQKIRKRATYFALGCGVFIGLAALFKYPLGIFLPLVALLILAQNKAKLNIRIKLILSLVLGFSSPILIFIGILWRSHALHAFMESQFGLIPTYTSLRAGNFMAFIQIFTMDDYYRVLAFLGFLGIILILIYLLKLNSFESPQAIPYCIILIWLMAAAFSCYSQGKFFRYHYLPLLPPLALSGAIALKTLFGPFLTDSRKRVKVYITVLMVITFLVFSDYPRRYTEMIDISFDRENLVGYWMSDKFIQKDFSLKEDLILADYLKSSTNSDDRVFIWGYEPIINFLSQRWIVSRFLYNFPLSVASAPRHLREELMRQLAATPPEVIIIVHKDETPWVMGHSLDSYMTFTAFFELNEYVSNYYSLTKQIGRFDIYARTHKGS